MRRAEQRRRRRRARAGSAARARRRRAEPRERADGERGAAMEDGRRRHGRRAAAPAVACDAPAAAPERRVSRRARRGRARARGARTACWGAAEGWGVPAQRGAALVFSTMGSSRGASPDRSSCYWPWTRSALRGAHGLLRHRGPRLTRHLAVAAAGGRAGAREAAAPRDGHRPRRASCGSTTSAPLWQSTSCCPATSSCARCSTRRTTRATACSTRSSSARR